MLCLAGNTLIAQSQFDFKPVLPPNSNTSDLERVQRSSIAFADVDGDNDQDVIITGSEIGNSDGNSIRIAKLYINDGSGNFTEKTTGTPFTGVQSGSIAFADVDGDNDPDVLITGNMGTSSESDPIAKLYTNDGSGNFTEKTGTPFEGVSSSFIAFADVDGDNDQDVLITGGAKSGFCSAKLYTNDGTGSFIEGMRFPSTCTASSFADVDKDGDQDVIIGNTLYINDGAGNFAAQEGTPFVNVSGSITFSDVDGDNDLDVLITGGGLDSEDFFSIPTTVLYINDGLGNFTEKTGTPLEKVSRNSVAFADIDGDNDPDVLITGDAGEDDSGNPILIAKLYTNDGAGNFTEKSGTPFEGMLNSSIAFADVDGDNDQDVLITGDGSIRLYTNDGSGNFFQAFPSKLETPPFEGVSSSSIAFANLDGDNDQDVLITGSGSDSDGNFILIANLYTNDGGGNFTEETGTPFEGISDGSIAFADVDGDNDQDVLITGLGQDSDGNFILIANLYTNDGSGNFTEDTGTPFEGMLNSSIAFADVDGDNDQDVLITGSEQDSDGNFIPVAVLYTNDGSGNFTEETGTPFEGVSAGSIAFADVDGDNDQDVLITGSEQDSDGNFIPVAVLYTNDGSGNFTEETGTPFEGVSAGSIAFADVDGDNDQDVFITGFSVFSGVTALLYINERTLVFTSGINTAEVPENTTDVLTVQATHADDDVLTYSVSGGADRALFTIDGTSGVLTFITAPDFEMPSDQGGDNIYEVEVTASDGGTNSIVKAITVTVMDADDPLGFSDAKEAIIFPNPSGDYLEVRSSTGGMFKILSLSGKPLLEGTTNTKVDITSLQSGLYLVQLPDGRLLKFLRE